ncbi:Chaperone DnaJ-domain superfamily protein [Raphanus sativus]|uniref:Auxilin-related protein 2 n=1 Tax=Raphanus sativus TaxID=3726 RepID=A0A9W3C3H1_RAPSA|nr:auxilin-related protein 2 [Raphanus sativus]KAJ4889607.1 Chaperone DnaJ-domain superfamily protein [Raphanus sativus]
MDEFGVLTERYGIKPQGKSAPMAASKRPLGGRGGVNPKSTWNNKVSGNETDDIFFTSTSTNGNASSSSGFKDFDVFNKPNTKSSSFNLNDDDLMFSPNFGSSSEMKKTSSSSSSAQGLGVGFDDVDLFGASSKSSVNDVILGSFSTKQDADDLLGGFGLESNTWNQSGFDGLIPGFGASSHTTTSKTTTGSSDDDPFVVLESTTSSGLFVDPLDEFAASVSSHPSQASTKLKPPPKPTQKVDRVKSSGLSSIDELEDFAMGGTMRRSASASDTTREAEDAGAKQKKFVVDDLDSFFSSSNRSSSVPKSRTTTQAKKPNGVSSAKKPPAPANLVDDFSALFGEDPIFREFEEIPGESDERRKARWDREQRTKSRVAQAVADMNDRDHQSRIEQEQRTRISENVDAEIRRWATGKEGNMRALLSSLQIVLWPGCGWEAVSLTDLITSSAVKKVYRKATLYVHPDKVQQKGATLEQKYIAEKVFDILKEAWNKFNKEELS